MNALLVLWLLLLLTAPAARAACDPALKSTTTPRAKLRSLVYRQCDWHVPIQETNDILDARAGFLDIPSTWTAPQTFAGGLSGDVINSPTSLIVNVRALPYSAQGDGTDESPIIQAAITENPDRTVVFPAGSYAACGLVLRASNQVLLGVGAGGSELVTTLDCPTLIGTHPTEPVANVTIRNLKLRARTSAPPTSTSTTMAGTTTMTLPIALIRVTGSMLASLTIDGSELDVSQGGVAVLIEGPARITARQNTLRGECSFVPPSRGIEATADAARVTIEDNRLACFSEGLRLGGREHRVRINTLDNTAVAIALDATAADVSIVENDLGGPGTNTVTLAAGTDATELRGNRHLQIVDSGSTNTLVIDPRYVVPFASLPAYAVGSVLGCADCTAASPCAAGAAAAVARRIGGPAWACD